MRRLRTTTSGPPGDDGSCDRIATVLGHQQHVVEHIRALPHLEAAVASAVASGKRPAIDRPLRLARTRPWPSGLAAAGLLAYFHGTLFGAPVLSQ